MVREGASGGRDMRVAIVRNMEDTPLGSIGVALAEAGAMIDLFDPWRDGALPGPSYDALIVLGGAQNALDDLTHPYLPALAGIMRSYGDADRPVLGVCLGAQVLARAHGAENRIGTAREFAWHSVTVTPAGRADPVLSAAGPAFPIFEWHDDTFTLPDGAVHLAASEGVPMQAFRIGRATYGMQFHFEANRNVVAAWTRMYSDWIDKNAPDWRDTCADEAARFGPDAEAAGLAIARGWVALIGEKA